MKKILFYLCICTSFLLVLVQCKNTVTQSDNDLPIQLNSPILIAPEADSDQPSTITFQWGGVSNANSYHFQISGNQNFLSTIVDSIADSTRIGVKNLPVDTTLYWKVRPAADNSNASWSEVWNFDVTSKPNSKKVILMSPEDGADSVPLDVKLKWERFKYAEKFEVQIATDKVFKNLVLDKIVEGITHKTASLKHGEDYYWRVKPVSSNKNEAWSEAYSFTTTKMANDPLPAPALVTPENDARGVALQPKFEWKVVDGADAYTLHVSQGDQMVIEQQVDGTSFTPSEKLSAETGYHWRVRAVQNGTGGDWSGTNSFTTKDVASEPLPAPGLVSPEDQATGVALQPKFEWKVVDGADAYSLHVSQGDQMVIEQQVDGTSFTPSEKLSAETSYFWRVRAVQNGTGGDWSGTNSFTTRTESTPIPPVMLISPSDGSGNQPTTVTVEWEAITNIAEYKIQLAKDNSFSTPVVSKVISNTYFELSGLENSQTYYWRVQASGDGDSQNWSSVWSFTIEDRQTIDDGSSTANERDVLMELYKSTGGDYWTNNSGWGQGEPSDSWYGIEVNANGRVTRVDLFENNLKGQLPASIGDLDNVTYLNVKGNYLTGQIPSEIGNMSALEVLILQGRTYEIGGTRKEPPFNNMDEYSYHQGKYYSNTNDFSGVIPTTVGNLSALRFLEISNAPNITGPIPSEIGNLSNLEGLYLTGNNFSGYSLPSSWENLTSLKHMYVAGTGITGKIPSSWSNLTGLAVLSLGGKFGDGLYENTLTGDIPDFSSFTNLRAISLANNNFTGAYPMYFNNGNFTKLHTLRMSWNNLTGRLHGFENLPYMKSFDMAGNNLSGSIDKLTSVPSNIRIISIGWNNFSGDFPGGWPDFSQIKTLYLNDNDLTGSIPCSFWSKLDNSLLNIAWTTNNNFTDKCQSGMNAVVGNGDVDIN